MNDGSMTINAFIDIGPRLDHATVLVPEHETLYVFRPVPRMLDFVKAIAGLAPSDSLVVHINKYNAAVIVEAFEDLGIQVKHTKVKGVHL
ncbi:MAG: hypothetical protein RBR38_15070 [Desulfomicrobium apsheronum]|nr:hypothetical protein [Desulfomicrobium apsheronum]